MRWLGPRKAPKRDGSHASPCPVSGPDRASNRQTQAPSTTLNASQIRTRVIIPSLKNPSLLKNGYRPVAVPDRGRNLATMATRPNRNLAASFPLSHNEAPRIAAKHRPVWLAQLARYHRGERLEARVALMNEKALIEICAGMASLVLLGIRSPSRRETKNCDTRG